MINANETNEQKLKYNQIVLIKTNTWKIESSTQFVHLLNQF